MSLAQVRYQSLNPNAPPFFPGQPQPGNARIAGKRTTLNIGHINVCSLRYKLFVIEKLVNEYDLQVLAVSETWLDSSISDNEVALPGFQLFRSDRPCSPRCPCRNGNQCRKAGGVAVFAKANLGFSKEAVPPSSTEMLWLRSRRDRNNRTFLLGCMYRPPSESVNFWQDIEQAVSYTEGEDIVLVGDLNVDFLTTTTNAYVNMRAHLLLPLGLRNIITAPTRITPTSSTSLDCILTNMENVTVGLVEACEFSDHCFIHTTMDTDTRAPSQGTLPYQRRPQRDFSRVNIDHLQRLLTRANLTSFATEDVNTMVQEWHRKFEAVLDLAAPARPVKAYKSKPRRHCPFATPELIDLVRRRKKAFRNYKASGYTNMALKKEFSNLRTRSNNLYRRLQNEHFMERCKIYRSDPRKLWATVNYVMKRKPPRCEPPVDVNNLNTFFHTIVHDPAPSYDLPSGPTGPVSLRSFLLVTEQEVLSLLEALDVKKATGPDGLSPYILKVVAPTIARSLAMIFNASLQSGVFPDSYKLANITPIVKARDGDSTSPANYRPVSLTPIVSKLLEQIVSARLHKSSVLNQLHDQQFGFRSNRSTSQLLSLAVNDWQLSRDRGDTTAVAYIDLSKAFDRVLHQQLLFSLHAMGICNEALKWFACYLSGRSQRVAIPTATSELLPVTRGVPQGSVLGPTLFNIYLRHLPSVASQVGAKLLMFADDKTLYTTAKTQAESTELLSSALDALAGALVPLGMSINVQKTVVMCIRPKKVVPVNQTPPITIKMGGTVLQEVEETRCLGIIIDHQLLFTSHIDYVTSKVSKKIGVLRRTWRQLSPIARRMYVLSVVQPDLEYAMPVFITSLSVKNRDRLFALHRRAVRAACGASYSADVAPLLQSLTLNTLEFRFILLFCCFVFQCHILQPADCLAALFPPQVAARQTRGTISHNFQVQLFRTVVGRNSFSNRASLIWNAMSQDIKSAADFQSFKASMHRLLLDAHQYSRFKQLLFDNVSHI